MRLLAAAGYARNTITAKVLTTTDTWGVHTHGTRQLRPLMKTVRQGRLNPDAAPELVAEGPAWAMVDGHYAMPMVTSSRSMEIAIRKARVSGLAYVGVKHSSHFGAAGYYAVMRSQAGMIGLSMCNVDPCVVVPGGRGKIIGTNPIAYAVPGRSGASGLAGHRHQYRGSHEGPRGQGLAETRSRYVADRR